MKRSILTLSLLCALGTFSQVQAQNLLVNGGFSSSPALVYYDGFDPTVADDVPGWILSLNSADGSYIAVGAEVDPGANGWDADMGIGPLGGGLSTAPGSRPTVVPGQSYTASLTYDNYFAPTASSYFVDWFDGVGTLLSSTGSPITDSNGPFTYSPYTQLISFTAAAPLGAASAGVRFTTGDGGYNGLAVDNFSFSAVPEPGSAALLMLAALSSFGARRRNRN